MSDNELEKPVKSGTAPLRRARAIRWSKRAGIALAVPVFYFMALGAEKDLKAIWSDLAGGEGEATEVSSGGDTEPKSLVERMTGRDADPARSSRQSGERSASSPRTLAVNTAAGARMRARPTSRSRSVAVLALGEKVTLIERRGAWAEL